MLPQIRLDRQAPETLHDQLVAALRRLIRDGRLLPGTRLPPSRRAADMLGVSRNVVVLAYDQLRLEGYVTARVGAGTWVPDSLPTHLLPPNPETETAATPEPQAPPRLSRQGRRVAGMAVEELIEGGSPGLFRPGAVAADLFPARLWSRISGRVWRKHGVSLVPYGDPRGYLPLREQLADHLVRHRAVRCDPDQIVVTMGSQHALNLLVQLLLDPGEKAAVEDPGYPGIHAALRLAGLDPVPVPVDMDGLQVSSLGSADGDARLIYATPSHQFPLGVTLPLERRLRLIEWARSTGAWIIEDDYDSEFRYESRPLPALQGMDRAGCVIYVGTFTKVLAPSLRLGFVVLPPALVEPFERMVAAQVYHTSLALQATLSEFMAEGHMERHISRLRSHYGIRWKALREALEDELGSRVEILPGAAGLHLTILLGGEVDDRRVARLAARRGLEAPPLSRFRLGPEGRPGLVLGFGASEAGELVEGVELLADVLDATHHSAC